MYLLLPKYSDTQRDCERRLLHLDKQLPPNSTHILATLRDFMNTSTYSKSIDIISNNIQ